MKTVSRKHLAAFLLSAAGLCFAAAAPAEDVPAGRGPSDRARIAEDASQPAAPRGDEAREREDVPDAARRDQPMADEEPSRLDIDLLRRLLGNRAAPQTADEDPLERAVRGMRTAHERIVERDTSAATRDVQKQVIDDLAALIELAKQPPPPRQDQNQSSQSPDQDRESQDQQQSQDEADSREQPDDGQEPGESQQQQQSDRAREAAQRDREREAARQAELARRQHLVDGVWGHLPPSIRNRILSGGGDEYLQDYEHLARRYFEALAEQSTRRER